MIRLIPWIERQWVFNLPIRAFPSVLERLRGTPARAADLVAEASDANLSLRPGGKWSVKDHLGHLNDLHALDVQRVNEFIARADALSAADMSNTRTEDARHIAAPISGILSTFSRDRRDLIAMLEPMSESDVAVGAIHPRLRTRIRLIDWAQFVAEHDDHHLAAAREALRSAG
jgi:hypothetical protein